MTLWSVDVTRLTIFEPGAGRRAAADARTVVVGVSAVVVIY
ncbi:hypothetical protein [Thermobifida alba]|nr:hypothetical protein [Thermobifida alba]